MSNNHSNFTMPDGRRFGEVKNKETLKNDLKTGSVYITIALLFCGFLAYAGVTSANMKASVKDKFEVSDVSGGIFEVGAKVYDEESNSVVKLNFTFKDGEAYVIESDNVTKDFVKSISK